jgi:hypothetical protein
MAKKIDPKDNQSNQLNKNKGTSGTNSAYDKAQGNRSRQMESKKAGNSKKHE